MASDERDRGVWEPYGSRRGPMGRRRLVAGASENWGRWTCIEVVGWPPMFATGSLDGAGGGGGRSGDGHRDGGRKSVWVGWAIGLGRLEVGVDLAGFGPDWRDAGGGGGASGEGRAGRGGIHGCRRAHR